MSEFNDNNVTGGGEDQGKQILIGRVTKIILGQFQQNGTIDPDFAVQGGWSAIGSIKFNLFQESSNPGSEIKTENFAKPLLGNIKSYPLLGEIVAIIPGPSTKLNDKASAQQFYYLPAYNLWNSQHHNAFPDIVAYTNYVAKNSNNQDVSAGARQADGDVNTKYPLGRYFKERDDIRTILPFEGDHIIEGRFGQSIRFGSTVKERSVDNPWSRSGNSGAPITIISNNKVASKTAAPWIPTVEDINKDGSQIWLSSGQAINMDVSMYPLDTFRLGFQAEYNPDTVLPLQDLSPSIQTVASEEYDKRVLENIRDGQSFYYGGMSGRGGGYGGTTGGGSGAGGITTGGIEGIGGGDGGGLGTDGPTVNYYQYDIVRSGIPAPFEQSILTYEDTNGETQTIQTATYGTVGTYCVRENSFAGAGQNLYTKTQTGVCNTSDGGGNYYDTPSTGDGGSSGGGSGGSSGGGGGGGSFPDPSGREVVDRTQNQNIM